MTPRDAAAPPLVLVGASVRALAESARRVGWSVHAADLFADADLRAAATVARRVPTGPGLPWPAGLERCLESFPIAPWLYSGALENHPDLVDRLAASRPLAGNAGRQVWAVRDPAVLGPAVRGIGLGFPDTHASPAGLPADGSFLVKPQRGAGGRGIAHWHGGPAGGERIWQRFVPGRDCSVAFAIDSRGPRLFGLSRQLVGRGWCGARGFAWSGAIDLPLQTLKPAERSRLERLGRLLAETFRLVGLVGVDVVVDSTGGLHVIEINPRPTASMELVERATGESVVATHLAACGVPPPAGAAAPRPAAAAAVWAKAVVFAHRPMVADEETVAAIATLGDLWRDDDGGWPAVADLPVTGTSLPAGGPAVTVFAAGPNAAAALRTVRGRAAAIRAVLGDAAVSRPDAAAARPRPPTPGSSA